MFNNLVARSALAGARSDGAFWPRLGLKVGNSLGISLAWHLIHGVLDPIVLVGLSTGLGQAQGDVGCIVQSCDSQFSTKGPTSLVGSFVIFIGVKA